MAVVSFSRIKQNWFKNGLRCRHSVQITQTSIQENIRIIMFYKSLKIQFSVNLPNGFMPLCIISRAVLVSVLCSLSVLFSRLILFSMDIFFILFICLSLMFFPDTKE